MYNDREKKLIRLALDPGAQLGEINTSAIMLINSLRARGVMADAMFAGDEFSNVKNNKMKFIFPNWGKHSGKHFDDIDPSYLQWIIRKWYPALDAEGKVRWNELHTSIMEYMR